MTLNLYHLKNLCFCFFVFIVIFFGFCFWFRGIRLYVNEVYVEKSTLPR